MDSDTLKPAGCLFCGNCITRGAKAFAKGGFLCLICRGEFRDWHPPLVPPKTPQTKREVDARVFKWAQKRHGVPIAEGKSLVIDNKGIRSAVVGDVDDFLDLKEDKFEGVVERLG
jgi:hypothetical protein